MTICVKKSFNPPKSLEFIKSYYQKNDLKAQAYKVLFHLFFFFLNQLSTKTCQRWIKASTRIKIVALIQGHFSSELTLTGNKWYYLTPFKILFYLLQEKLGSCRFKKNKCGLNGYFEVCTCLHWNIWKTQANGEQRLASRNSVLTLGFKLHLK